MPRVAVHYRCRQHGPFTGRACVVHVQEANADRVPVVLRTYEGGPAGGIGTAAEAARVAGVPRTTAMHWLIQARMLLSTRERHALQHPGGPDALQQQRAAIRRVYTTLRHTSVGDVASMLDVPWSTARAVLHGERYGLPNVLRPKRATTGRRSIALQKRRTRVWRAFHVDGTPAGELATLERVSVWTIRKDLQHPGNPYRQHRAGRRGAARENRADQ